MFILLILHINYTYLLINTKSKMNVLRIKKCIIQVNAREGFCLLLGTQ